MFKLNTKFEANMSLACVAQWTECWPVHQRVTSSIPGQGTCLDCGPGPQLGTWDKQPHIDISSLYFSLPSPLSKINFKKSFKKLDAYLLLDSLSHFECDDHIVPMLTQWPLPPPLISTVKSS